MSGRVRTSDSGWTPTGRATGGGMNPNWQILGHWSEIPNDQKADVLEAISAGVATIDEKEMVWVDPEEVLIEDADVQYAPMPQVTPVNPQGSSKKKKPRNRREPHRQDYSQTNNKPKNKQPYNPPHNRKAPKVGFIGSLLNMFKSDPSQKKRSQRGARGHQSGFLGGIDNKITQMRGGGVQKGRAKANKQAEAEMEVKRFTYNIKIALAFIGLLAVLALWFYGLYTSYVGWMLWTNNMVILSTTMAVVQMSIPAFSFYFGLWIWNNPQTFYGWKFYIPMTICVLLWLVFSGLDYYTAKDGLVTWVNLPDANAVLTEIWLRRAERWYYKAAWLILVHVVPFLPVILEEVSPAFFAFYTGTKIDYRNFHVEYDAYKLRVEPKPRMRERRR